MSLIQCINLGIQFAGQELFSAVNCTLEHKSRVGLIGANGSGKSTLVKLILGILQPSAGQVLRAKKLKIAYLAQDREIDPNQKLIDYITEARPDIKALKNQMQSLSEQLSEAEDPATLAALNSCISQLENLGAFEHENQVKYVLESLGFPPAEWQKEIRDFSGGEKTRLHLAAILLKDYDLLILDEPTNHLDLAMTRWLERFLDQNPRPYLVVSHDRSFLNSTVRNIYYLNQGSLKIVKGNYDSFYEAEQIEQISQQRQYERQQKLIRETEAFIQKNIAGQKTKQAKSRLKMLQRMDIIQKPQSAPQRRLQLADASRSGNDVFILKMLSFGIGEELTLGENINISAHYQDRIALIGPNGCGKTTLLKLLIGERDFRNGELKVGASLELGYFDQYQHNLDETLTVLESLWQLVPNAPQGYVLSWLARFGFTGDAVDKKVAILSGGEKSRLYLSVLIHEKPNLLILDEPTNHLDIPMRDALLNALKNFGGTIIFVSHDRHFIQNLATKYWVFTRRLEGAKIIKSIEEPDLDTDAAIDLAFTEPDLPKTSVDTRQRKRRINPWHLENLQEQIHAKEAELSALQTRLSEIHSLMSESSTYQDAARVQELNQQSGEIEASLQELKREINDLENQYLELSYE